METILALESERIRAMIDGDLAALDRILADDLTYVHSTGRLESKAELMGRLGSGELRYRAMPREDVRVRLLGGAAIVTGRAVAEVESAGHRLSFPLRFTALYAEREGRWRMVAWHSSRIE